MSDTSKVDLDRSMVSLAEAITERMSEYRALVDALEGLVEIIDKAGLNNLANGVRLGPTVWFVRATERMEAARSVLARVREGA